MNDISTANRIRISRQVADLERKQTKLVDLLLEMGDKEYLQRKLSEIQSENDLPRWSY